MLIFIIRTAIFVINDAGRAPDDGICCDGVGDTLGRGCIVIFAVVRCTTDSNVLIIIVSNYSIS